MPIYTCTTAQSVLTRDLKAALAVAISRIHSAINHVPSTYVNVVFHELPSDSVFTDGVPACRLLISGWVRDGHPEAETTRLATEIADAVPAATTPRVRLGRRTVSGWKRQPKPTSSRR